MIFVQSTFEYILAHPAVIGEPGVEVEIKVNLGRESTTMAELWMDTGCWWRQRRVLFGGGGEVRCCNLASLYFPTCEARKYSAK